MRGCGNGGDPAVEDGELVGEGGVDGNGVGLEPASGVLRLAEAHTAHVLGEAPHRFRSAPFGTDQAGSLRLGSSAARLQALASTPDNELERELRS